jgi:hypothetical protein
MSVCVLVLFSCQKENSDLQFEKNNTQFLEEYKQFSQQSFEKHNIIHRKKLKWYDWACVGIMDCAGIYEGAKIGGAVAGPWGAGIGGVLLGAATSYVTYRGLTGIAPPNGLPVGGGNPDNLFEYYGVFHNEACWAMEQQQVDNELVLIYDYLSNNIEDITDNAMSSSLVDSVLPFSTFNSVYTLNNPYSSRTFEKSELKDYFSNFGIELHAEILADYLSNSMVISNVELATQYSIEIEEFISNSEDLTEDDKSLLLASMSVFRHSINLWSNN